MATQRSFLIELEPDTDLGSGRVRGRIEHVAWGDCGSFASLAELVEFMSRALRPLEEPPGSSRAGGGATS
jgi:hypothetical protein